MILGMRLVHKRDLNKMKEEWPDWRLILIEQHASTFLISRRNSRDVYWGAYTSIRLSMHILYIVPNVAQGLGTNLGHRRYELT